MKLTILGGFLGSGKTTIIRHYLDETIASLGMDYQLSIIENDHGQAGVDALLLETEDVKVWKISGGCVCCSVTGDLIEAIEAIYKEFQPNEILVELTGIAKPGAVRDSIAKYCKAPIEEVRCVTVIDMSRFHKLILTMPDFILEQCKKTDYIMLNKTDSFASSQSLIENVKSELQYEKPVHIWDRNKTNWRF